MHQDYDEQIKLSILCRRGWKNLGDFFLFRCLKIYSEVKKVYKFVIIKLSQTFLCKISITTDNVKFTIYEIRLHRYHESNSWHINNIYDRFCVRVYDLSSH
jgi:hypothetical protein